MYYFYIEMQIYVDYLSTRLTFAIRIAHATMKPAESNEKSYLFHGDKEDFNRTN